MKLHFLSYVLNTLQKEVIKQYNEKTVETKSKEEGEEKLVFESLIKKWLTGRPSDGFEERLEFYVQDAIKGFPYPEMPLFIQFVRSVATKPGETWALDVLQGIIYGQGLPDDEVLCTCCASRNPNAKKCSKCKAVQYCDRLCQRLHWNSHKKFCAKLSQTLNEKVINDEQVKD